ncbi:MAG: S8 family serine peptidase [Sphingomonas sp.]|uniref:S8 family serine peptidase n=1 Tax=Sphingomonas sp. TaxID=28214 RepID=UPI001B2331B5|nr:S8 family serine peptidase [Sphingomonas sp.]MBO9622386.1 S8 family serine peptidase [Sphingomonas sp.]
MIRLPVLLATALLSASPALAREGEAVRPVKIAVVDSGIARTPLLAPLVVAEYDMAAVFRERPAFKPVHDHGTEVATVIAREARAPIQIYSLRIDTPGKCVKSDPVCSFLDTNMVAAIDKAVELGVDVINLSIGGEPTPAMKEAIVAASAKGIKVAIAAGNRPGEPRLKDLARAGGRNVWLVGAVDEKADPCAFSAAPRNPDRVGYQFVWRRGAKVETQDMEGKPVKATGTSFSTPFVTAEIASKIAIVRGR